MAHPEATHTLSTQSPPSHKLRPLTSCKYVLSFLINDYRLLKQVNNSIYYLDKSIFYIFKDIEGQTLIRSILILLIEK